MVKAWWVKAKKEKLDKKKKVNFKGREEEPIKEFEGLCYVPLQIQFKLNSYVKEYASSKIS